MFVCPHGGADSNPGTAAEPVASLPAAQALARGALAKATAPTTLHVRLCPMLHQLTAALNFSDADNPGGVHDVRWAASGRGGATVSAGQDIVGWQPKQVWPGTPHRRHRSVSPDRHHFARSRDSW
eukprot:COSAG04_NODE_4828_length_1876_cov_1.666292_2_plen_125_part_00